MSPVIVKSVQMWYYSNKKKLGILSWGLFPLSDCDCDVTNNWVFIFSIAITWWEQTLKVAAGCEEWPDINNCKITT